MKSAFKNFTSAELKILQRLSTPQKIQDYLDLLEMNFSDVDPCFCPQQVMQKQKAHCMEGALFAAAALWFHGHEPLLLDLTTIANDEDHVVALFKQKFGKNYFWGAISKTNHAVLRYREPVYRTVRELALSYFHEYFLDTGKKTLRSYSMPFNLARSGLLKLDWLTSQKGIMELIQAMSESPHLEIISAQQIKNLRKADAVEISAGKIVEWKRKSF